MSVSCSPAATAEAESWGVPPDGMKTIVSSTETVFLDIGVGMVASAASSSSRAAARAVASAVASSPVSLRRVRTRRPRLRSHWLRRDLHVVKRVRRSLDRSASRILRRIAADAPCGVAMGTGTASTFASAATSSAHSLPCSAAWSCSASRAARMSLSSLVTCAKRANVAAFIGWSAGAPSCTADAGLIGAGTVSDPAPTPVPSPLLIGCPDRPSAGPAVTGLVGAIKMSVSASTSTPPPRTNGPGAPGVLEKPSVDKPIAPPFLLPPPPLALLAPKRTASAASVGDAVGANSPANGLSPPRTPPVSPARAAGLTRFFEPIDEGSRSTHATWEPRPRHRWRRPGDSCTRWTDDPSHRT